jgi:hypothetical protein
MGLAEAVVQGGVKRTGADEHGQPGDRLGQVMLGADRGGHAFALRFEHAAQFNGVARLRALPVDAGNPLDDGLHGPQRLVVAQLA